MRRAARPLLYAGVLVVVFGLAQIHAALHRPLLLHGHEPLRAGRSPTPASCASSPTASGSPTCPAPAGRARPRRRRRVPRRRRDLAASSSSSATRSCPASWCSAAALLLPDWYRLCVGLAVGGRSRAEARDRVVVVAHARRGRRARARAARLAGAAGVDRRRALGRATAPRRRAPVRSRRSSTASCRRCSCSTASAQDDAEHRGAGRRAPRARRPGALAHAVLRGVARQAPALRARAGVDAVRHRRGPPARYGRAKRILDVPLALVGVRGARSSSLPFVLARQPRRPTAGRSSTARSGSARAARASRSSSSARWRRDRRRPRSTSGPTEDDPRITPLRPDPARRPTSTSCRRWSTSCGATSASSDLGPSSRTTSPS